MQLDARVQMYSVVGCHYPSSADPTQPAKKFRPVLVMGVKAQEQPPRLYIIFGTGQGTANYHEQNRDALLISANPNGEKKGPVVAEATRFNFKHRARLPLEDKWFWNSLTSSKPQMTFYGNLTQSDETLAKSIWSRINPSGGFPSPVTITYKKSPRHISELLKKNAAQYISLV